MSKQNSTFFTAFLLLMCLSVQDVCAQMPVRLGIAVSPLTSWYRNTVPDVNGKIGLGYQLGVTVDYSIDEYERYELSSGLLITRNNGTLSSFLTETNEQILNVSRTVHYLEIPLTFKATITEFNYFRFFGQAGVIPAFKVGETSFWDVEGIFVQPVEVDPGSINTLNFSMTFGGGAEYAIGDHAAAVFGLHYAHGLVSVLETDEGKVSHNYLVMRFGFLF
jgi:opacity protein-like surface antigen